MKIYDNKLLIAIIRNFDQWKPGLDFITPNESNIQVGTWNYDAGKVLERHEHNRVHRKSDITQECVFVVQGKMLVKFYSKERKYLKSVILKKFDYAVIFDGGHEYKILCDDTRIIETKNGPFLGVELDKTKY